MTITAGEPEPQPLPGRVGSIAVARATLRVLGRPVLRNALALNVALGIPAAILFTANGLRTKDIAQWVAESLVTRGLLWATWLALSAPALGALFGAPGSRTLRALRLPRAPLLFALFILGASAELPWALLFAGGGGPLEAWAAVTLALVIGAASIAARRKRSSAGLVLAAVACVLLQPPVLLRVIVGSALLPLALAAAWRLALEEPRLLVRLIQPASPFFAISAAHLLRLARAARSRLIVALVSGGGGIVGLVLSLKNDPTERPVQRALTALALPLTLAAAVCVAPVLDSEARLRWLFQSLRVPRRVVIPAFLLAVASPSSALAATAGVAASHGAHVSAILLASVLLSWALILGCAVAVWGRLLESRARRTAGTFAAGVTLIAALALVLAFSW